MKTSNRLIVKKSTISKLKNVGSIDLTRHFYSEQNMTVQIHVLVQKNMVSIILDLYQLPIDMLLKMANQSSLLVYWQIQCCSKIIYHMLQLVWKWKTVFQTMFYH